MALKIELDFASATRTEVLTAMTALQTWDRLNLQQIPEAEPMAVPAAPSAPDSPATMTGETPVIEAQRPDPAPTEEAPKVKRGRPKKTEVAAEQVDPTPSETSKTGAEPEIATSIEPDAKHTTTSSTSPTATSSIDLAPVPLDELRAALKAYIAAKGGELTHGSELLNKFGAQRVGELGDMSPEKQHAFIKEVEEAVNA